MAAVTVVHLVWAPLGPEVLERFTASLAVHPAGREHRLLVVWNGFGADGPGAPFLAAAPAGREDLVLPAPVQDLAAYRRALDACPPGPVVFLNSFSRVLADGWLATLAAPLAHPEVGLVGASGSWESAFSSAPLKLRGPRLRGFPPFPNPSLRTNAWGGDRDLLRGLDWRAPPTKLGALELESGRRGLTRQVRRRGLQALVVGRDGRALAWRGWPASATFRAGGQHNLLVADNRTDHYLQADAEERRRLARMAWGRRRGRGD